MYIVQEIQRKFNCKRLYIDKMSFLFEGKTKKKNKTCIKYDFFFQVPVFDTFYGGPNIGKASTGNV